MREYKNRIEAIWCFDSETGREYLVDLTNQEVIAERVNGKLVNPRPSEAPNAGV